MGYQVEITSQADEDLAEIVSYLAKDNGGIAEVFGMQLIDEALLLSTFPYRGSIMRGKRKARKLVYGKCLIIYMINEQRRYIAVLRFLHGARIK